MRIRNSKLKLLIIVLILFSCNFFINIKNSFGIYKSNLYTTINLTVLDPSTSYVVTLDLNDGTGNINEVYRSYNQKLGNVNAPARTNYNFLGWYDGPGNTANPIYSDEIITGPVTFYAHWQKIICKKVTNVNNLHTETCATGGGCRRSGIDIPLNSTITYGTIYGPGSPIAGDAYDCDVNDDGIYNAQVSGKFTERFYFLRQINNVNSDKTGALVYYTSYDNNGPVDSQNVDYSNIGAEVYDTAITWLPTSSTWDNTGLIDFDAGNGKVTRLLSFDDVIAVCGPGIPTSDVSYFGNCSKWFLMENSRFQSETLGRSGIWVQPYNNNYYRIHTGSINLMSPDNGNESKNMTRPVIEIPISAFEGYKNVDRYTISFDTHGGLPEFTSIKRYSGEVIGVLEEPTLEHNDFAGWYAESTYNTKVTSETIVTHDMTLHAKWIPRQTSIITFDANGGTINGESTYDLVVDTGSTISEDDYPEAIYEGNSFDGWYIDLDLTERFDETEPITDDITLYASWANANYVARVKGVGYETLALALGAVPTTGEKTKVTILRDITLTEAITIPSDKWVEIDGGNHTISGAMSLITNNGKLDIISGIITTPSMMTKTTLITNGSGATLNISGGVLTNPSLNGTTEFLVITNSGGTVNITGGSLNSYGQSAAINNNSGTLNMSGGEIIAHSVTKGQAIYMAGGTVNISGNAYLENVSGTGESRATVDNYGGTLNIVGGTIVSKGWSAVMSRKNGSTTTIGDNSDGIIDISTPILRGQRYGLERSIDTTGTIRVYDGIFESYLQNQAISTTSVTKPDGIDFKTDGTIDVNGVTYHVAYLLAPSITINFYVESNGTAIPVVVDNGTAIGNKLPTPDPKEGYYFVGWFIDGNPLKPVTSATVVTGPFRVYAKWVQSVYNATMDNEMSIQINNSKRIEFQEEDIESVTYSSSDTDIVTVDIDGTVHAVSIGTATITLTGELSGDTRTIIVTVTSIMSTVKFYDSDYNPNDLVHSTLIDTLEVVSGSVIASSDIPSPTNSNYVLNAWYINGNNSLPFTSETVVNEDTIVVANWKEKVSYATLSTRPSPFELIVGNTGQITLSPTIQNDEVEECTFTSNNINYATVNSTSGQVTGTGVGDTYITVTGNLSGATVLVPVSVDVQKYTVTFKDGNSVLKTVIVESGSSVGIENMPINQAKANYIFNGWVYDDNNYLTPFTYATEVYGNIDVLVSWKETLTIATLPNNPLSIIAGANKQILVTATGGGLVEDYVLSSSNSNYVEVNGKIVFGANIGSVTLSITGVESGVTRTITVNVVEAYNVTFDPDNGEEETVIQVASGSTIDDLDATLPTDPTKENYVFDRWYLYDEANETLTTTPLDTTVAVTNNITYKAKWVSNTYYTAIGTNYYTSISEAISKAPTNTETEIRIIQDISNPSGQTIIPSKKNIILNGGNHTVSSGASTTNQLIFNQGILRIVSGTFTCGKSGLATLENNSGATLYIDGGVIENTNDRGAIYNNGAVEITGGTLTSIATERGVVQNAGPSSSIKMSGGTVIQYVSSSMGALHNGKSGSKITITGGTVTSVGNAIQNINGTTLVIGTQNGSHDVTSPVIQGELYGVTSTVNYSIYDGIIKGKTNSQAVDNFNKITGTEQGLERVTGTDGGYYTLYYEISNLKYHINFNANGGEVTPTYKEFSLNNPITSSDLPTPTRENHTFDGWYTDNSLETPFTEFTPNSVANVTYYAKWTFNSSFTSVSHNILSNAMQQYFTNVSTWVAADANDPSNDPPREANASNGYNNGHQLFKDSMNNVFTTNSCSYCDGDNRCENPQAGTYCDYSIGYNTGLTEDVNVYLYENGQKGSLVTYTTSTDGVIYNMIPGVTYLWESVSDNTKYGVVTATGNRRTLKTSVRNLRDMGGLSASNETVSGTIDYGRLYRGAQITSSDGVTDLNKLGITREIDLRGVEGIQTYKLDNYDTGTKSNYTDIVITNYIVNPIETTYITTPHLDNYRNVKNAIRAIMEKVVFDHDNIFFHCTIGTDRTGTMAYFLEGLLGVSEEDRLRDYEMTYFFGLTNRTRFHDSVSWSNTNPRFYSMYRSYPTNADIYNYYTYESHVVDPNNPNDLTDEELLRRFRLELIH